MTPVDSMSILRLVPAMAENRSIGPSKRITGTDLRIGPL